MTSSHSERLFGMEMEKGRWILIMQIFATLLTASRSWRGVKMTPDIWREPQVPKSQAFGEHQHYQDVDSELVVV